MLQQLVRIATTRCRMVNSFFGSTLIYSFCDIKYCGVNAFITNNNACVHAKTTYRTDTQTL